TVLDHIIITQDSYFSFLEHGMLKKSVGKERSPEEWQMQEEIPGGGHLQNDHSPNDYPQNDHSQDAAIFE
ncbi:MAG: hypothetical protein J6S81_07135, partial [Treponema sp.]|nr:hypothetical protein [Treponema sp.]